MCGTWFQSLSLVSSLHSWPMFWRGPVCSEPESRWALPPAKACVQRRTVKAAGANEHQSLLLVLGSSWFFFVVPWDDPMNGSFQNQNNWLKTEFTYSMMGFLIHLTYSKCLHQSKSEDLPGCGPAQHSDEEQSFSVSTWPNMCCLKLCPVSVKLQRVCGPTWRPSDQTDSSWHQTICVPLRFPPVPWSHRPSQKRTRIHFLCYSESGGLGWDWCGSAPALSWLGRAEQVHKQLNTLQESQQWASTIRTETLWETDSGTTVQPRRRLKHSPSNPATAEKESTEATKAFFAFSRKAKEKANNKRGWIIHFGAEIEGERRESAARKSVQLLPAHLKCCRAAWRIHPAGSTRSRMRATLRITGLLVLSK